MISIFGKQFMSLIALGLSSEARVDDCLRSHEIKWMDLLDLADKQTMIGILYGGMLRLVDEVPVSISHRLQVHSAATFVIEQNRKVDETVNKLFALLNDYGIHTYLLKGQGVGSYYPLPEYRQSGDIDIFAYEGFVKVNSLLSKQLEVTKTEATVKHQSFEWDEVEIENHNQIAEFYSAKYCRIWNQILCDSLKHESSGYFMNAPLFPPQLNLLYIFIHFLHHLMREGVGLRQLCDWLVLLRAKHAEIDMILFLKQAEELGLTRAMTAACYIGAEYLGFNRKIMPFDVSTSQAQEDGDFMLKDILTQGNFGHESGLYERGSLSKSAAAYWGRMKRLWKFRRFQPLEALSFPFSRINYWLSK